MADVSLSIHNLHTNLFLDYLNSTTLEPILTLWICEEDALQLRGTLNLIEFGRASCSPPVCGRGDNQVDRDYNLFRYDLQMLSSSLLEALV
jgi:hypothetical protein